LRFEFEQPVPGKQAGIDLYNGYLEDPEHRDSPLRCRWAAPVIMRNWTWCCRRRVPSTR
jgi:hypothetical protein